MNTQISRNFSLGAALAAALTASACCVGPLVFALLGIGGAGSLIALEPYRPALTVLTLALLGVGFIITYRTPRTASVVPGQGVQAEDCDCERPRTKKAGVRLLWGAAAVVLLALVFPSLTLGAINPAEDPGAASQVATHTAQFDISGMTCASCSVTVRAGLGKLEGIESVQVDAAAGRAIVRFDGARVSVAEIAQAISATGYPAAVRAGEGG